MENCESMFSGHSNRNRGQNGENVNLSWDIWELNASRFDWGCNSNSNALFTIGTAATSAATSSDTELRFRITGNDTAHRTTFPEYSNCISHDYQQHFLNSGDACHLVPDSHLMCLKLGKRHYLEDAVTNLPLSDRHVDGFTLGKRGKTYCHVDGGQVGRIGNSSEAAAVPRCQVEGCHVALFNAKDYHKRHRVCEVHAKAPKVIVLGLEQRFCQQCSRFHVVSEFDASKRSCRRRLAGHNERRRKSCHDSVSRNCVQDNRLIDGGFPYLSSKGCALSLLSSNEVDSRFSPSDLSLRSSAALRELIAEHRAAILARQLLLEQPLHYHHTVDEAGESQAGSNSSVLAASNVGRATTQLGPVS